MASWPRDAPALDAEQRRLARLAPPPAAWAPSDALRVAGVFVAFAHGEQGPGRPGDRCWAGAAAVEVPGHRLVAHVAVPAVTGASYEPGRLALREGPALAAAVAQLPLAPHAVLVDATGRDHPRGAGLALQLGAVLDVPTVGVTTRPLVARGEWPRDDEGAWTPLRISSTVVGAWLRTRAGARPVVVHAAWRTDVECAVALVRRCVAGARTPEPLRQARHVARVARAIAEGRWVPASERG